MTDEQDRRAIAFNAGRGYPDELGDAEFVNILRAAQVHAELLSDGMYGTKSQGHFDPAQPAPSIDLATVFAKGVHPMPIYGGVRPMLTSGFIAKSGRGPNKHRLKYTGRPHYGGDIGYWWDSEGEPPLGWKEHHFAGRQERLFYCPEVPVGSILDGEVEYAGLLPVSEKWGGPRWTVKVYHGDLEGFGHFSTWSTHHKELLVRERTNDSGPKQVVAAGEAIAIAGETGTEGAPHNHQEGWRWQTGEQFTRETHALDLAPILPHLKLVAA